MTLDKVDIYLMNNAKYFPPEAMPLVREKLAQMPEDRLPMLAVLDMRDPTIMLVISIVVGTWGVDRFMLGDVGMGVLKLLTGGLCGVLTIIDWFTVMRRTREKNLAKLILTV